ncbi:MAG: 2-oxoacid:acceptor oxidoreductase family protein [Bacteroidota bacterium]
MIEIRLHGRGGQGGVVACKILAAALYRDGKYAQAFPAFGVERRGAPVQAFIRIDDKPVRLRCQIEQPDHLIVLDPTLLLSTPMTKGLKKGGIILLNSEQPAEALKVAGEFHVITVDANAIAVKHRLGTKSIPIVNTAILGAFARTSDIVSLTALLEAVRESVPSRQDENVAATQEAYDATRQLESISSEVGQP